MVEKKARQDPIVSVSEHLDLWLWELTWGQRGKEGLLQEV